MCENKGDRVKGIFYYLNRVINRTGAAARCYMTVHANPGVVEQDGRLNIRKNVVLEIREGGRLKTGKGTVTIQNGCRIVVENGGELDIGDDVGIYSNCYIAVHNRVSIGNNTIFGPGVVVVDQDHDYRDPGGLKAEKYRVGTVTIGNNVWIGANAVILRGSIIEDNSVIGAGSVVKGHVQEGSVYINRR